MCTLRGRSVLGLRYSYCCGVHCFVHCFFPIGGDGSGILLRELPLADPPGNLRLRLHFCFLRTGASASSAASWPQGPRRAAASKGIAGFIYPVCLLGVHFCAEFSARIIHPLFRQRDRVFLCFFRLCILFYMLPFPAAAPPRRPHCIFHYRVLRDLDCLLSHSLRGCKDGARRAARA